MKRFLICAVALLFLLAGSFWLFYYRGFYLDWDPDAPVEVPFQTEDRQIQVRDQDGTYQTITLKGVELTASMPGQYASSYEAEEADYLRWLENIGDMGANLIQVSTLMDDDFYNALYSYNTSHSAPLYLLQGISVTVNDGINGHTAYGQSFLDSLIRNGKDAVDIIHGRKNTSANGPGGQNRYRRDVSGWVVGYILDQEWDTNNIAYMDQNSYRSSGYQGTFLYTADNATHFETMLAQVMDSILVYENDKYHAQRLIGFRSAPDMDFLEYEEVYARQLGKYAHVDPEHILPAQTLESGCFAGYRLYDFCRDFSLRLSDAQKQALAPHLAAIDVSRAYGGYLDLLGDYHTMPVIAAGYGFTTSRGATVIDEPPLTEIQQGQQLMTIWEDACHAGWAGVCISTWQDVWERRSWNTAFATELSQSYLWHDLQTEGENYGLMAYEPGLTPTCVIDGNWEEWAGDTPVLEAEGYSLFVRYDQEGLYLLVRGTDVSAAGNALYIPMDLSPELGSRQCESPSVSFDRDVDFLLCIQGTAKTRLLVQARYDAMRENFNRELNRGDPFLYWPEKDSPEFVKVGMVLNNDTLVDNPEEMSVHQLAALTALGEWEAGLLRHGNGDPENSSYDSLADFCFGEGCVEICIPWLLLNVADPTEMRLHQDYYTNYGVLTRSTSTIWIGLGTGAQEISLSSINTRSWDWELTWRERLKQSYDVIQSHWRK